MILNNLEQGPLYNAVNFSLLTTDPGSQTVRKSSLSVFLCPSNAGGSGPLTIKDGSGNVLVSDLSPGQYVAVAGQWEPEEFPAPNNGVFYRNSKIGLRDITDGSSTTLMAGERSQNVANATWVGMIPFGNPATTRAGRSRIARRPTSSSSDTPGRRPMNPGSMCRTTRRRGRTISTACIPAAAISCSATAPSGSSRRRSTRRCSAISRPARAARSSVPISIDLSAAVAGHPPCQPEAAKEKLTGTGPPRSGRRPKT